MEEGEQDKNQRNNPENGFYLVTANLEEGDQKAKENELPEIFRCSSGHVMMVLTCVRLLHELGKVPVILLLPVTLLASAIDWLNCSIDRT